MKLKKICAVLSAVSLLAVAGMGQIVSAEEVPTEVVTNTDNTEPTLATTTITENSGETTTTTEISKETSTVVTEASDETTTTVDEETDLFKKVVLLELATVDKWNSGDFSKTVELSSFGYDFGSFTNLIIKDKAIDSSNYIVSQNGNESITFTLNEAFIKSLSTDTNYFTVDFENVKLESAFVVSTSKAEENTKPITNEVSNKKVPAPKTGNNSVGLLFGLLAVSGATAFISKKKN